MLQAELVAVDGLGRMRGLDAAALVPAITAKLGDWSGLMGRRIAAARQMLRHLLVGRITFTQRPDGAVEFVGCALIGPLIAGTVLAEFGGKALVSPTGFARFTPLPEQLGTTVFEGVVWPRAA